MYTLFLLLHCIVVLICNFPQSGINKGVRFFSIVDTLAAGFLMNIFHPHYTVLVSLNGASPKKKEKIKSPVP